MAFRHDIPVQLRALARRCTTVSTLARLDLEGGSASVSLQSFDLLDEMLEEQEKKKTLR